MAQHLIERAAISTAEAIPNNSVGSLSHASDVQNVLSLTYRFAMSDGIFRSPDLLLIDAFLVTARLVFDAISPAAKANTLE